MAALARRADSIPTVENWQFVTLNCRSAGDDLTRILARRARDRLSVLVGAGGRCASCHDRLNLLTTAGILVPLSGKLDFEFQWDGITSSGQQMLRLDNVWLSSERPLVSK